MPELQKLPVPGNWKTALTDAALAQQLANKQTRRPAALHAYYIGAARRWHLSWVKNSGPDFEDWGWTASITSDDLKKKVAEHSRVRLFLVEPIPGTNKLAAVWLIRPEVPAPWLTWGWEPEIAAVDLKNIVPAGHRVTCIRALAAGASKVAAIWTQDDSGAKWDWDPSLTFDDLHVLLRDSGSRLVTLDSHGSGANLRYSAAWVANVGPGAEGRTWFWFAGVGETYLRGQTDGLCSHPVELCDLGGNNLAAILNRTPAPGSPPDDVLLDVTGTTTLDPYQNDPEKNPQMGIGATVNVNVTNVAGVQVDIIKAELRWASCGGQIDSLPDTSQAPPPNPVGGTSVIPTGASAASGPIVTGTGLEYRDILVYVDAKTSDGRRQRLLRPLPVQRPTFAARVIAPVAEPVALVTWTDTADVIPMWRGGTETQWINVAGTIINLTGDDLSITRMDVEIKVDGEWRLEKNLPLQFQHSVWPDERSCDTFNGGDGCIVVDANANGTLDLGKKVLNRFVHGLELDVDPQFQSGNVRLILHYQRKRKCGTVLRDLPMRWTEPVDVLPPLRGKFMWKNALDHSGFDAHAWPGPRAAFDIEDANDPHEEGYEVYPMADGTVVEVHKPDLNDPGQSVWVWHESLGLWTGYFHLQPGALLPAPGDSVFTDTPMAKLGMSGAASPHLHTGGHILDATGFGRVMALRFSGLIDDQGFTAKQTPATGVYTS